MPKTKNIINRDLLIKASRLELRLTKVQKDEPEQANHEKVGDVRSAALLQ